MPAPKTLRVLLLAMASLIAVAPLQAQFASRPASVQLVAQLPPTVGVSWTLQALKLPPDLLTDLPPVLSRTQNATADVLVLQSRWVLAKGHAASYECRVEGAPQGQVQSEAQLIALQQPGDPAPRLLPASLLAPPPATHLSLLNGFLPQRGQHHQIDGILILSEMPAAAAPRTLRVRIVVL